MTDELDHGPAPLFQASYSPKLIRFWLLHWPVLSSLAEQSSSSRDLSEWHAREWALIQAGEGGYLDEFRRLRQPLCLCVRLNKQQPAAAPSYRSRSGFAAPHSYASQIRADLEHAADRLPIWWKATAFIFVRQERLLEFKARLARWSDAPGSSPVGDPEPEASLFVALERMARSLGWGSRQRATG